MTRINEITITTKDLLKDFSDADIKRVTQTIKRKLGTDAPDVFGLPYTSCGAFAGLWNTNCERELIPGTGHYIQGFALSNDRRVIAYTQEQNDAETEHFYDLGQLRYTVKTIDIEAKQWFDKVNGNSYFSARATINFGTPEEKTFKVPFQYGYGSHFEGVAFDTLKREGVLTGARKRCTTESAWGRVVNARVTSQPNRHKRSGLNQCG